MCWRGLPRSAVCPVTAVREKGLSAAALQDVSSLGKLIGPPWTQDQKYATLAALVALGGG